MPQSQTLNSVAERMIRTITDEVSPLYLLGARLYKTLRGEAVFAVTYLINKSFMTALKKTTRILNYGVVKNLN